PGLQPRAPDPFDPLDGAQLHDVIRSGPSLEEEDVFTASPTELQDPGASAGGDDLDAATVLDLDVRLSSQPPLDDRVHVVRARLRVERDVVVVDPDPLDPRTEWQRRGDPRHDRFRAVVHTTEVEREDPV